MPSPLQQSRSLAVCEAMLPHCLPTLEPRRKYGYVYKEGERKTEGTIRLLRAQGPPGSEPNTHRNNSSPLPGGGGYKSEVGVTEGQICSRCWCQDMLGLQFFLFWASYLKEQLRR